MTAAASGALSLPAPWTFVIARRLSTIHQADVILVMDQGRLAEKGSHAKLIAARDLCARLHALPFTDSV